MTKYNDYDNANIYNQMIEEDQNTKPKYGDIIIDVRWETDTDDLINLVVRTMKNRGISLLERSKFEEELIGLKLNDAIEVCKKWIDTIQ